MRLTVAWTVLASLALSPVFGEPTRYALSTDASTVAFETDFGTGKITGKMPISRADLILDFADVRNSQVDVTLDVDGARANFPTTWPRALLMSPCYRLRHHAAFIRRSSAIQSSFTGKPRPALAGYGMSSETIS